MYSKKVDLRSRKAMTEFLENHFRYNTMNSWNRSTSWANNVKYYKLDLTSEQQDKFFELLSCEDSIFYDYYVDDHIRQFRNETGYDVGFNGRSGGYLVMYDGKWVTLDYKSQCSSCFQLSYAEAKENDCRCGRCGKDTRVNLSKPMKHFQTYPGRSIDQDLDCEELSLDELRDKVKLVCRFDKLCDDIRDELVYYLDSHEVEEEEYTVTKTRKVFKEVC